MSCGIRMELGDLACDAPRDVGLGELAPVDLRRSSAARARSDASSEGTASALAIAPSVARSTDIRSAVAGLHRRTQVLLHPVADPAGRIRAPYGPCAGGAAGFRTAIRG